MAEVLDTVSKFFFLSGLFAGLLLFLVTMAASQLDSFYEEQGRGSECASLCFQPDMPHLGFGRQKKIIDATNFFGSM